MHLGWRVGLSKELWPLHRSSRARAGLGYACLRVGLRVGLRVVGLEVGLRVVGLELGL